MSAGCGVRRPDSWLQVCAASALWLLIFFPATLAPAQTAASNDLRGALLTAGMVTSDRLAMLKDSGYSGVVLAVSQSDETSAAKDKAAAEAIQSAGLTLHYFLEVARCPELADEHSLWMASLQGHPEWRRFYKNFPEPRADEVVKCYPWVPVFYQEAYEAHLERIEELLASLPPARSIFLNDLQGAPSACGCGNPVCRWTTDYGPIVTATRLGDDAAAKFVAAVRKIVPRETKVIPVWTTECEEHDKENDALCAGVSCYRGICWQAYARQLRPVAEQSEMLGALLLYKDFFQDVPHYQRKAGWISHAIKHGFAAQPTRQKSPSIKASRIVAILQGWDVSAEELSAQVAQAEAAGAAGYIVAFAKIDQSWSPKIVRHKPEAPAKESSAPR